MPRRYLFLIAGLLLFCGAFLMIAFRRQAPAIPADPLHLSLGGRGGRRPDCMACHGPGQAKPRGPNHPFGEACGECHLAPGESGRAR